MGPPITVQNPERWDPKKMARASGSGVVKKARMKQPGIVGGFITSSRVQPRMPTPTPEGLGSGVDCVETGHSPPMNPSPDLSKGKGIVDDNLDSDCKVVGKVAGEEKDVVVVDKVLAATQILKKRKSREYELNRTFQDRWAIKYAWAELVHGANGKVTQVRCLVCTKIEGRQKLLVAKSDSLNKHDGQRTATEDMTYMGQKLKAGDYYILQSSGHIKNEASYYMTRGRESVVTQLAWTTTLEKRKKMVQFTFLFYLLSSGSSMLTYKNAKSLFTLLKVLDNPGRHWSDTAGWEMADSMSNIVRHKTKDVIAESKFISVSADEVTTIDTQSWLSIHIYVVKNFKRFPMLLSLQRITEGATANNLYELILADLRNHGGLSDGDIAQKLMCFGADGDAVFQGCKKGVTTALRQKAAPYSLGMHCVAHRTNLAAEKMNNLPFVSKLEIMCTSLARYFKSSAKRVVEFQKLAEKLETGGNKLFLNVKSRWISLLPVFERIHAEYKTLVVLMYCDSEECHAAEKNYYSLSDISNLVALPAVLPLLRALNQLSKFAQGRDVYICEYVASVRQAHMDIYEMYVDPATSFTEYHFQDFTDLVSNRSHTMSHEWITDVNGIEQLKFRIGAHLYSTHLVESVSNTRCPVTRDEFLHCISQVKRQCTAAAELIISELDKRFPDHEQMDALGVVFPKFWLNDDADEKFEKHLETLVRQYGTQKSITSGAEEETQVTEPLDGKLLIIQQSFF